MTAQATRRKQGKVGIMWTPQTIAALVAGVTALVAAVGALIRLEGTRGQVAAHLATPPPATPPAVVVIPPATAPPAVPPAVP